MKWVWVLLLVLITSLSASAASWNMKKGDEIFDISTMPMHSYILDGTIKTKSGQVGLLKFNLLPLRDLPNIRTQIRLYFDKDLLPGEDPTAQCYIKIKKHGTFPLRDYLTLTGHGPEVWLSYLTDRQLAEVFIIWQPGAPELQLAQSEVESYPFQRKKGWITKENWNSMWHVKVKDRPAHFREVLLDDVCLKADRDQPFPFSDKELKTFQFFK